MVAVLGPFEALPYYIHIIEDSIFRYFMEIPKYELDICDT
jgi:hypothetical protein